MPNYNGVWSLSTQYQYAADWPNAPLFALVMGGAIQSGTAKTNICQRFDTVSSSDAVDFGDLATATQNQCGFGSATLAFSAGGDTGSRTDVIETHLYTNSSTVVDFGNLAAATKGISAGMSNSTRGVISGGEIAGSGAINVIQYVTMASAGNSSDFGDATSVHRGSAGCASTTRGVSFLGETASASLNIIDYITIGSTGNATDFGDQTNTSQNHAAFSNSVRGIRATGYVSGNTNVIEYITIDSAGNATDFGDLVEANNGPTGFCNAVTGFIAGGENDAAAALDRIQKITIGTTGNASDFANLATAVKRNPASASSAHGGIA